MSLHYLLDGYNVIKQSPRLERESLRGSREKLVRYIEMQRPHGSRHNRVTVVFDGRSGISYQSSTEAVKVIFSQDEPADETIKAFVSKSRYKKNIVVVTNDRALGYAVRPMGARVMKVDEFLAKGSAGKRLTKRMRPETAGDNGEKHISKTTEHRITSEFEDIWLRRKSDDERK